MTASLVAAFNSTASGYVNPLTPRTMRVVCLKASKAEGEDKLFLPIGKDVIAKAGHEPDEIKTLTVNGMPILLDKLGPVVVNPNGALGSIANWHELSEAEQAKVMGKVAKRNQQRLAALREARLEGPAGDEA